MALPGQTFNNGVSNYIFGVNTPNYDTTLMTNTQVQAQMLAAGVTVIRTALGPPTGNYSDSQLDQLATAISNSGAAMLAILPHNQSAFAQHVVSYLGSRCLMYEYSNERDINNESWQTYLAEWNAIIPLCRAANPSSTYIGPVLGVYSNIPSYLIPWLQGCKSSGVLPDAISVHIYPCTGGSIPQQTCLSRAAGIGVNMKNLRTQVQGVLGFNLPVCLTEWNADAYYANPTSGSQAGQGYNSNASSNNTFNSQFAIQTLEGLVANQVDMGCLFELDYFMANKNGATSTAAQYLAMQSESTKYVHGGSPTPVGTISATPSALTATSSLNGTAVTQNVVLKNTGTASGVFSSPISYSAYGNLNWIIITSSSTTLAAGASETVQVSATPQNGMAVGTYTGTITFSMGTSSATVTVTLTINAIGSATSHIYIPTNSYPTDPSGTGTTWAQYEAGAPAVALAVVAANVAPGATVDANFTTGILNMHNAGVKVLGYVNSSSSGAFIAFATVTAQIDMWYSLYNIDGIQLDNVLATTSNYSYYQNLFNYINAKDAVRNYVMLNAQQVTTENYVSISDSIIVFQNSLGNIGLFSPQSYMANYPSSNFAAGVTGVTNAATVDSTMLALQNANVGLIFITDQTTNAYTTPPGTTVWNQLIKDSHVGTTTTGGGTGGGVGGVGTTPLTLYLTATPASTITTANLLYAATSPGTPATIWHCSRISTALGYGEVTSQGAITAWAAASTIPAPTGKGYLYDVTTLVGQQIVSGNWAASLRLNGAQSEDNTNPEAGTLIADIIVRAYKYNGGIYTPIVSMTLGGQTIGPAYTSFTLPSTAASAMTFGTGDKLYIDNWINVLTNANASTLQDIRINRQSTDTTGFTGDAAATIGTPGFAISGTPTGGTGSTTGSDTFTRANQTLFGTASDGEAWTITGTGATSILSNTGVIVSTGTDTHAQLGTNTLADVDVRCRITLGLAGDFSAIEGRYSVSGGNVTAYKLIQVGGTLCLKKTIGGTITSLTSVPYTPTAGVANQYHLRIQGSHLYGNVYPDGSTEPSVWMVTATDTSIVSAAGYAIQANTASGSSGVAYDHFSANSVVTVLPGSPLIASPTTLAISAVQGGGQTTSLPVTLTTNSATSGAWSVAVVYDKGFGWLTFNMTSGTLAASGTQVVSVSAIPAGLSPGTYTASLAFALGTASQTVLVTFVISPSGVNSLPVVLTLAGKELIATALTGNDSSTIRYVALGTGATTPSASDTQLVSEVFRKTITSFVGGVNPGEILANAYISPSEAVGLNIQEVGIFAGNAATGAANTGILLARGLYQLTSKTNLESVQLVLDIIIQ